MHPVTCIAVDVFPPEDRIRERVHEHIVPAKGRRVSRRVSIQTPLGDALQFRRLTGREAPSQAYVFDVDLLGNNNAIDPKALLGKASRGGSVDRLEAEPLAKHVNVVAMSFPPNTFEQGMRRPVECAKG